MRKTIKGLEEELAEVRRYSNAKDSVIAEHKELLARRQEELSHFKDLSNRLLNILEWNAKEGKGYGKQ